jgi:rhamnogalacturonan endolyase
MPTRHRTTAAIVTLLLTAICRPAASQAAAAAATQPVAITQTADAYTLTNGIVTAKVSKSTGELLSMVYKNIETMYVYKFGDPLGGGHPWGYWEQTPGDESRNVDSITIDPAKNGGDRGEVSVKGYYVGTDLTPGAPGGGATTDIEIRYTIGRGESGVYTTAIYTHAASYPAGRVGEARWGAKLNPAVFDWMSVDWNRNKMMLTADDWSKGLQLNAKEIRRLTTGIYKGQVEHKYDYSAVQFDTPAFGWSSTTKHIGWWCINPTIEYLSGGPTKVELTCHRDLNDVAAPTVLDYWHGGHYGGGNVTLAKGEAWTKVVGPIFNYVNSADTPDDMFKDALSQAGKESAAWPYDWLQGVDYPHKPERATVTGTLNLDDPQGTGKMTHVVVGLSHPDVPIRGGGFGGGGFGGGGLGQGGGGGGPQSTDWQTDAKYYQFWVHGSDTGEFTIPNIRPGTYTLHAIADGVLGEYDKTNITVAAGQTLDLGKLDWQPVRYGRQVWDIGIPNRSAKEFLHGDHYWQWGLYLQYASDFPNDVNYIIGKSDFHTDWNYAEVPHWDGREIKTSDRSGAVRANTNISTTNPAERAREETRARVAAADAAAGTAYNGRATPWSITYDMPTAPKGKATLRLAICGGGATINVSLNGKPIGNPIRTNFTRAVGWDGIQAVWQERDVVFDASLMKLGTNVMKLTVPPGSPTNGVEYDYLRLELDESAAPTTQPR